MEHGLAGGAPLNVAVGHQGINSGASSVAVPQNPFDACVDQLAGVNSELYCLKQQLSTWLCNFSGSTPLEDDCATPEAPRSEIRTSRLNDEVRRLTHQITQLQALISSLEAQ